MHCCSSRFSIPLSLRPPQTEDSFAQFISSSSLSFFAARSFGFHLSLALILIPRFLLAYTFLRILFVLFITLFLGWWGMGVLVGSVYVFVLDYIFLSFLYMFAFDRCSMIIILSFLIFFSGFLYGSIWFSFFVFFSLVVRLLSSFHFPFIRFFSCFSSCFLYNLLYFRCFHPDFNPLSSICLLYRSSVFSMPLCFSLAFPFHVLVFLLLLNFLYHDCIRLFGNTLCAHI